MRMNESLDGERWKSPGKEKKIDMYFYIDLYGGVCVYIYILYISKKSDPALNFSGREAKFMRKYSTACNSSLYQWERRYWGQ